MSKAQYVYVTYIAATPERIWTSLTEPEFTRQYWQAENVSDWNAGSTWEHRSIDPSLTRRVVGNVVENSPPRRLVLLTWADPAEAANKAKHSHVTFELEPIGDMVRLPVTHSDLGSFP